MQRACSSFEGFTLVGVDCLRGGPLMSLARVARRELAVACLTDYLPPGGQSRGHASWFPVCERANDGLRTASSSRRSTSPPRAFSISPRLVRTATSLSPSPDARRMVEQPDSDFGQLYPTRRVRAHTSQYGDVHSKTINLYLIGASLPGLTPMPGALHERDQLRRPAHWEFPDADARDRAPDRHVRLAEGGGPLRCRDRSACGWVRAGAPPKQRRPGS